MATFSEVEDMRDWFIDTCAEMRAKLAALNGDEDAIIIEDIGKRAIIVQDVVTEIIKDMDKILILKKIEDYS